VVIDGAGGGVDDVDDDDDDGFVWEMVTGEVLDD
jgi:hypothetical protein